MKTFFTLLLFTAASILIKPARVHAQAADTGDSLALVDFYNATNGPGWTNHTNWLTGPLNTWYGVTLDKNGKVKTIILDSNSLAGTIPAQLCNITTLEVLDLSANQLSGGMPVNMGNSTGLVILDVSNNNLEGGVPLSLNNLTAPTQINVTGNRLQFASIGYLKNKVLSVLNFNDQQLVPLVFDTANRFVYIPIFISGPPSFYPKIAWYIPEGNNPDDDKTEGAKVPTFWRVLAPGYFQCTVSYTVTLSAKNKYRYILYSKGLFISDAELPVNLTTFTGQLTHGRAYLNWQTATELNASYFSIQRSTDGTHFTTVGTVAAAGTSTVTKNYQYTDALTDLAAMPAALYYRLQQVDKDGKQSTNKTIVLTPTPGTSSSLIMYPNPVHSVLNLRLKNIPGNAAITITGADGKTLLAQTAKTVAGGQTISLNTTRLAAGVYVVHVQYNGQSEEQKFVKE